MTTYPTTPLPLIGYSVEPLYYTQRTPTKSGADVTEKLWDTPRFRIKLPYRVSATNGATILNFFHERYGGYDSFDFIDFMSRSWESIYIGTGDGTTSGFEIPFSGTSALTVYVDGVEQTLGVSADYGVALGGGTNGRDSISFVAGSEPPDGDLVTIDATGYRYFVARFENDAIRYQTLQQYSGSASMWEFDVTLISQRS